VSNVECKRSDEKEFLEGNAEVAEKCTRRKGEIAATSKGFLKESVNRHDEKDNSRSSVQS
jgi:hypothetical protein